MYKSTQFYILCIRIFLSIFQYKLNEIYNTLSPQYTFIKFINTNICTLCSVFDVFNMYLCI